MTKKYDLDFPRSNSFSEDSPNRIAIVAKLDHCLSQAVKFSYGQHTELDSELKLNYYSRIVKDELKYLKTLFMVSGITWDDSYLPVILEHCKEALTK